MFSTYRTNVFSEDIFEKLKEFHKEKIETAKHKKYSDEMGRYYVITRFPEDITKAIVKKAEEELGMENLDIVYAQIIRYQIQHGEVPFLIDHTDKLYCTCILDIGIGGTIDWPLIVEGKTFPSVPNSVVFLKGELDYHSRPEYPSSDEEDFLDLIFVHIGQKGDNNMKMADNFFSMSEERFEAALRSMILQNDPWYGTSRGSDSESKKSRV